MCLDERRLMAQCITCGSELHPERAKKYDYCMAPACQEKNLKGLAMVAVGVNKAADQYLLLDEQTRDELASGKFRDQRRGSFGTSLPSSGLPSSGPAAGADLAGVTAGRPTVLSPLTAARPRAARHHARRRAARGASRRRNWRFSTTSKEAATGDSRQTRLEPLYRLPDHPDLEKPGKALSDAPPPGRGHRQIPWGTMTVPGWDEAYAAGAPAPWDIGSAAAGLCAARGAGPAVRAGA